MRTRKEFIFSDNVPFDQCHASTLLCLPDGSILAAWFGGSREGAEDVMIWISRRESGVWSAPRCVSPERGIPHWNPVLDLTDDGVVILYYKAGHHIPFWKTMVTHSRDNGVTWSQPRELVPGDEGGRGPVKNKLIRCSDGTMLAPASIEKGPWRAFIDRSSDGYHWEKTPIPVQDPAVGMIQPTLWESPEGQIHALLRTDAGRIYRSDSEDFGRTWSPAYPTALPNNNSGLDCVLTRGGTLALICNPVGQNWGPRFPLSLFISRDFGGKFQKVMDFEADPGEYSYPAVVSCGETLHITYTYNRKNIAYWEINL